MRHNNKSERKKMGAAIVAVLVAYFAFHMAFPEVKLWPLLAGALIVVPMLISHLGSPRKKINEVAQSETL
ncbi:MAG: hypothetical protein GY839_21200 [candidate division Zixibacteria bacterium]|nr:hypothetical protein [candidate division Zixibacteria bacterium]